MSIQAPTPADDWDFWREGLDRNFFRRVYTRATQLGVAAVFLALGFEHRPLALGLGCGMAVGLFSMYTVELTTRLMFGGGGNAGLKLAIGAVVKMPVMLAGLILIAWASYNRYMDIFGVVGGVLIAHTTMLIMALGTAMASQASNRERYR